MKKALLLLMILTSINFFAQDLKDKNTVPLTEKEFYDAVKKDFNALLGNDEKAINNALTTNFDEKETSVSLKFLIAPTYLNKDNRFNHLFAGAGKFGESNAIYDLGKSNMPLVDFSVKWYWLFQKTWFYSDYDKIKKEKANKIIVSKDSLMKNKENYYYTLEKEESNQKDSIANWTFKRYFWTTTEINYKNAKYKILDISKTFDEQLFDEQYSNFSGTLGINFYGNWINESSYWKSCIRPNFIYGKIDYTLKNGNNIKKFEKVEVTDYEEIQNGNITRQIATNTIAYRGTYKTFQQHVFSSELIVGIHKNISLDMYSSVILSNNNTPLYTYGGGFYFLVKNKKGESNVNLGLFIEKVSSNDAYIGFKTSLPISL